MQIAIVGLGSILMGDDGVGPYFLQVLEGSHEFPENVHLRELGTPGPDVTADVWWSRGGD